MRAPSNDWLANNPERQSREFPQPAASMPEMRGEQHHGLPLVDFPFDEDEAHWTLVRDMYKRKMERAEEQLRLIRNRKGGYGQNC